MLDLISCFPDDLSISEGVNSGKSSMSSGSDQSHCTSFSRLSFEILTNSPEEHNPATLMPHRRSSDSSFQTISGSTAAESSTLRPAGPSFRDFSLLRQIGSGDIGKVYLCRLRGGGDEEARARLYAMKVVDNEALAVKNKVRRAETERKILRMLNHPFLPTLYAEFQASHFSCVVMEYCPGGDLHSLRHKLPHKRFSLSSARFYAAEVLVALEYLHLLGIIYRDLKPENVLVRSDGHIMLTDFDLSLCSDAITPAVESQSPDISVYPQTSPAATRIRTPFSCFSDRLFRSKKIQTVSSSRMFVAEPITARSCSFVGTHEYVAPEVASGGSHGNAVDWWAFGIFMYEMIYGGTPFAGASNEDTLRNIVQKPLTFPNDAAVGMSEMHARDLISGLLNRNPTRRLGARRGSADVKTHPFFKGLNFALIRSVTPPSVPGIRRLKTTSHPGDGSSHHTAPFDFF